MEKSTSPFDRFSPEEIKHIKAQVGAALNYTRQGSFAEALGTEMRKKLTDDQIDYLINQLHIFKNGKDT